MGFEEPFDRAKNLFEYHAVFASDLAIYLNIRKELESKDTSVSHNLGGKRNEAMSIVKSNLIYAIQLKRNDAENKDIPTQNEADLIRWLKDREEIYRKDEKLSENDILDCMFALMTRKQEVAGLTANSEKTNVSRMNMLIDKVASELRRDG